MWGSTENLGSIGSAVLTFIVYKHPDKQGIYINISVVLLFQKKKF